MDNRFLDDVLGDCAGACRESATILRGLPAGWLPMRAALAWVRAGDHAGPLPGGRGEAFLCKSEDGYDGRVVLDGKTYTLRAAADVDVAALVAAVAGLEPVGKVEADPSKLARFGSTLEAMAKSHNAKKQRDVSREVADRRVERYARTLGLVAAPTHSWDKTSVPSAEGNKIEHGGAFKPEHELAHAILTPVGATRQEHIDSLSAPSPSGRFREFSYLPEPQKTDSLNEEYAATAGEGQIRRRAGVKPDRMQITNRAASDDPTDLREAAEKLRQQAAPLRSALSRFDAGARFTSDGRVLVPAGIDAKINARAARKGEMGAHAKPIAPVPPNAAAPPQGPKRRAAAAKSPKTD